MTLMGHNSNYIRVMHQTRWSVFLRSALAGAVAVVLVAMLGGSARAQEPWTVTPTGIGPVTLGASIDEVREALPEPYVLGDEVPIAPDLQGHVVSVDGAVHLLIPATDTGVIETIIVLDDSYQTIEGIGPRSLIGDAEDVYGDVRLEWSEEDQGRERVLAADGPPGLSFRASEAVGPQAGIYGNDQTSTVLYDPASRLTSIWIVTDERVGATGATEPEEPAEEPVEEAPEPEEEPVEEEPVEEEPEPEPEPEEEAPPAEEPAEEEPAPTPTDNLPETGVESTTVALAAASTLFIGLGVARIGRRMRPWS